MTDTELDGRSFSVRVEKYAFLVSNEYFRPRKRKKCFGFDTLVTNSYGELKLMRNLKIGDEVVSDEKGTLTKFIGWMELNRHTETEFIEIETLDGEKLILTESHNVFFYKNGKSTPTYASNLIPGDLLVGGSGKVEVKSFSVEIFTFIPSGENC